MTYLVFIDTRGGGKNILYNYAECKHQVEVLRNHGYSAWWEFFPPRAFSHHTSYEL